MPGATSYRYRRMIELVRARGVGCMTPKLLEFLKETSKASWGVAATSAG